jgi:hypothetical protein
MRIAIIGNRDLTDKEWIYETLDDKVSLDSVILLGGAAGVQDYTAQWCGERSIDMVLFKPWHLVDFDEGIPFSPKLFFLRNKQIIDNADKVLVLTNGTVESEVDRALQYALGVKDEDTVEVCHYYST